MQATQTHRITPKEHTLDNSHREHTHRYTTHKQSPHPSSRADTDSTPYKHTQGLTHTLQRATAPTFPWTDTTTPCGPQHKLGARHTHTPRRDTCRSTTPHTRAPTAGPDAPPALSQPPHPAAATCARPARQARAGPITGCCWGAAPARRSRRLRGPRAAPCRRPQRARAWGVAAPPCRTPPAPPGLRGPGQSGSTHFPGAALAARGRCRARTPLFVNKPARPLRHLRSRTLSASSPETPAQGPS